MIRYHARWVLPISSLPIRDGTVIEHEGRITYVGPRDEAPDSGHHTDHDLGDCALLPGLVNAHTHLELTVFRGLLEDLSFREWIARLQGAKVAVMSPGRFLDSARWGIVEGLRAGITTFADTCDSGVVLEAMRERGVRGIMYQEVFSPSADPAAVREAAARLAEKLALHDMLETELQQVGVSPHAPYTVSDPLFAHVARMGRRIAVHIAESDAEHRFVCEGEGPFADAHRARGFSVVRRADSPIALLAKLGVLDAQPLLIHCVRVSDADIASIASSKSTVAHCPISNAKLGHGVAPVLQMLDAGIAVGLGSDSMAANNRMHLLEESRAAVLAQRIRAATSNALPSARALALATLGGARALGLDAQVGSLEVGKAADLAAFDLSSLAGSADADPESALVFALGAEPAKFVAIAGVPKVRDWELLDEDLELHGRVTGTIAALREWMGAQTRT
ncbi:MAG TPA: amidohydrolase family protein [Gemmatimonadaceae bacterium]|nr:amidohydrolase family protein [Gemmatimonadaceae bacterium]